MLTMPMVESRPEGRAMPEHQRGVEKRDAILKELYRREIELEPPPTSGDLGRLLGVDQTTAYFHLVALRDADPPLVTWVKRAPRTLRLTPDGRSKAEKI